MMATTESLSSSSSIDTKLFLQHLLGKRVKCTLLDDNNLTATGRFVCVDRLMNIILTDCVCEQKVTSDQYDDVNNSNNNNNTINTKSTDIVERIVQRQLQQAMVPGNKLKSIQIEKDIYDTIVSKIS